MLRTKRENGTSTHSANPLLLAGARGIFPAEEAPRAAEPERNGKHHPELLSFAASGWGGGRDWKLGTKGFECMYGVPVGLYWDVIDWV